MNYKTRQPFPNAAYVEGQRNFTYFDRSLTSGLTDEVISSPGDFLYIDQASTGVVSVELNMRQGGTLAPILLAAGGSIECDFASIKINATAQLNKTVRIVVGNGARIKGGATVQPTSETIQTVDGSRFRTDNGTAFISTAYCGNMAANYAHAQFWNPANSGKNAYINKLIVSLSAAGYFQLRRYTTALANLWTPNNPSAKKLGASASATQLRYEFFAAITGTGSMFTSYAPANTPFTLEFTEPIQVPPGYGLNVINGTVNQDVVCNFEHWEE